MKKRLDEAKKVLVRQEAEDIARCEENVVLCLKSDSGDSELDTLFEQQYGVREDQWKCI